MPNETNTPQDPASEASQAASAARRLFTPRRVIAGAAIATAGLWGAGQAITNAENHAAASASANFRAEHSQNVLKEISDKATSPVDPADIAARFGITEGKTIYSQGISLADAQPEYVNGDETTKEWIDKTIRESSVAQGSYDIGDNFVISHAEIDGKETFIVQNPNNTGNQTDVTANNADVSGDIASPSTH